MKRYMESHGILSEHDLMFYGPEGKMTLEEARAKGYDVGLYLDGGPLVRRDLGAGLSLYELENRNQRDYERRLAAQMQNAPVVQMQALTRNKRRATEREMDERMRVQAAQDASDRLHAQTMAMLQANSPALRYAKSQEPGGLEAGPAKHMGTPCAMPRPGWRERLRQWRRR